MLLIDWLITTTTKNALIPLFLPWSFYLFQPLCQCVVLEVAVCSLCCIPFGLVFPSRGSLLTEFQVSRLEIQLPTSME